MNYGVSIKSVVSEDLIGVLTSDVFRDDADAAIERSRLCCSHNAGASFVASDIRKALRPRRVLVHLIAVLNKRGPVYVDAGESIFKVIDRPPLKFPTTFAFVCSILVAAVSKQFPRRDAVRQPSDISSSPQT